MKILGGFLIQPSSRFKKSWTNLEISKDMSKIINAQDVITYLEEAKSNYVIIQYNGEPVRWSTDGSVVVYSDMQDAKDEKVSGDTIITEYDYIISQTRK